MRGVGGVEQKNNRKEKFSHPQVENHHAVLNGQHRVPDVKNMLERTESLFDPHQVLPQESFSSRNGEAGIEAYCWGLSSYLNLNGGWELTLT